MPDTNEKQLTPLANMISLITAAIVSSVPADIFSFPFGRVKTVMMTQTSENTYTSNTYQTVKTIYKTQGILGFYRGFMPLITSAVPGTALFFSGVHTTQSFLGDSVYSAAIGGFVGQMTGSIVWVPADVLRELRQMTATTPEFQKKSVSELTTHIYKQEGIKGLYRGFMPQFFSYGPFNSIGLSMSTALHKMVPKDTVTVTDSLVMNGISYGLSAFVTTPFDVVKTRIQVAAADPVRFSSHSFFSCAYNIVHTQGVRALYSGAPLRAAGLGSRQAVAFTLFEKADKMCRDYLSAEKETPRVC